jgi:hypothetical protein
LLYLKSTDEVTFWLIGSHAPKIVSGGQTDADRAALDWALSRGIECGGWCPKGRKAEDGPIRKKYPLIETPAASYVQRTEWNVRDTGGTVIFSIGLTLTGGTLKTVKFCEKHTKPYLELYHGGYARAGSRQRVRIDGLEDAAKMLKKFVSDNEFKMLNVAWPRASKELEVGDFVKEVLAEAFP